MEMRNVKEVDHRYNWLVFSRSNISAHVSVYSRGYTSEDVNPQIGSLILDSPAQGGLCFGGYGVEKLGADISKAQTKMLMQWALLTYLGVLDVTLGLAAVLCDSGHRLDVGSL